ncbi:methyltransferase domain-containing protein [Sphingobacterium sp. HJSM2_6]|uniref:methyltransferase domain-containing protein n=1 Tax=Sphingobacterium sp. HJSM2_6 TaxID=3366264 RepID=UPI003BBEA588
MEDLIKKEYWNNRWIANQKGWDIGYPSPAIVDYLQTYPDKQAKILIPGCGNAYEASFLLDSGFRNITLLDLSANLIDLLKEKFNPYPEVKLICANYFDIEDHFDLIIEQTFFCALDPRLRGQYVQKTAELLKTRGKLIGLLFNRAFEQIGPPYAGEISYYRQLFQSEFIIHQLIPCRNSIPERQGSEVFLEFEKK